MDSTEYAELNEEIAVEDFYRRQFYAELRFGIRKWTNRSTKFLMPPFTLLKQFGGVLPAPNGYGFSTEDTIDNKRLLKNAKDQQDFSDEEDEDDNDFGPEESFIKKPKHINQNLPPHIGKQIEKPQDGMLKTEQIEFEMPEDEFWKWVEKEEEKSKKLFEEEFGGSKQEQSGG